MGAGERFRANAELCYRLAVRLRKPEHQQFARELAAAWIALAEQVERAEARSLSNGDGKDPPKKG
jgi:hypothetical protein